MANQNRDESWQPGCFVALAALAAVFVGFGFMMAACAQSLADFGGTFSLPDSPEPPASIPIPRTSCVSLRAVQLTAADAGQNWGTVLTSSKEAPSWRAFSAQLGPRLARFDDALHAAVPNAPAPVAAQLREVIRQVDIGRAQLPHATSEADYAQLTDNAVAQGYSALSTASALVGNGCGFTLAPGLDAILPVSTTTVR